MVVLAASIVSKSGKALVSRQYMDMSRIRIEGLLAAFPKLVGSGKQHTYVETENVRYVYQPIEGMFLLLVTNRGSNILEDLDTLRLLSKLVPEYAGTMLDEEAISRAAFDLIFAFDEVISLGHKENISVMQVKQNCEMESHEEKLHKMIIQSKINDTKDIMKRKAMEIDKHKMEVKASQLRSNMNLGPGPGLGGMGSSSMNRPMGMDMDSGPSLGMGMGSSGGGFGPSSSSMGSGIGGVSAAAGGGSKAGLPRKGMQLGKSKGASSLLENLAKEEGVATLDEPTRAVAAGPTGTHVISEPVFVSVDEKLTVLLSKTGGLESLEVQGTMSLVVGNDADAYVAVQIRQGNNPAFQFKTHPNIDKAGYSNGVLGLKDPSRPFPTGSELGVLKWRFQSKDEDLVPLSINAWPSASGKDCYVNIEYESNVDYDLQGVVIAIPLPHLGHAPTVNQVDGDWRYDSRGSALIWTIDLIDNTNRSGSLEFVVPACDPEVFYPVEVQFSSPHIFCDIAVETVSNTQNGDPVKYGTKSGLSTASYQVV